MQSISASGSIIMNEAVSSNYDVEEDDVTAPDSYSSIDVVSFPASLKSLTREQKRLLEKTYDYNLHHTKSQYDYEPLEDEFLQDYLKNPTARQHLEEIGLIEEDGTVVNSREYRKRQIMMDRAFQEQYLQKTDQEKELDRKIYDTIIKQNEKRNRATRKLSATYSEDGGDQKIPDLLGKYPVALHKTALIYSNNPRLVEIQQLRKRNRQNAAKNMSPTSSPTRNQFDLHQRTPSSPNKATERPLKNVKIDPTQLNIAGIEEALRNEDAAFDLKWTQCEKYLLNCVLLLGGDLNDVICNASAIKREVRAKEAETRSARAALQLKIKVKEAFAEASAATPPPPSASMQAAANSTTVNAAVHGHVSNSSEKINQQHLIAATSSTTPKSSTRFKNDSIPPPPLSTAASNNNSSAKSEARSAISAEKTPKALSKKAPQKLHADAKQTQQTTSKIDSDTSSEVSPKGKNSKKTTSSPVKKSVHKSASSSLTAAVAHEPSSTSAAIAIASDTLQHRQSASSLNPADVFSPVSKETPLSSVSQLPSNKKTSEESFTIAKPVASNHVTQVVEPSVAQTMIQSMRAELADIYSEIPEKNVSIVGDTDTDDDEKKDKSTKDSSKGIIVESGKVATTSSEGYTSGSEVAGSLVDSSSKNSSSHYHTDESDNNHKIKDAAENSKPKKQLSPIIDASPNLDATITISTQHDEEIKPVVLDDGAYRKSYPDTHHNQENTLAVPDSASSSIISSTRHSKTGLTDSEAPRQTTVIEKIEEFGDKIMEKMESLLHIHHHHHHDEEKNNKVVLGENRNPDVQEVATDVATMDSHQHGRQQVTEIGVIAPTSEGTLSHNAFSHSNNETSADKVNQQQQQNQEQLAAAATEEGSIVDKIKSVFQKLSRRSSTASETAVVVATSTDSSTEPAAAATPTKRSSFKLMRSRPSSRPGSISSMPQPSQPLSVAAAAAATNSNSDTAAVFHSKSSSFHIPPKSESHEAVESAVPAAMPHKVEVAQAHDITLGREASILVTSVPHLPAHPQALEPEDKVASIGSMEGTGEDDEDYEQEQTTNEQLPHHNEALSHESEGGVKGGETVKPHDLKIATSSASASHGVLSSMTVSPISTEPSFALPAASAGDNSEQAKTQHLPHPPHSKPVSAAQKSSSMNQSHNSLLRAKMIQEGQVQHVPLKDNTSSVESNKSLPRNAGGGGGGIAAATAIIASIAPSSKQRSIDDLLNGSKPNQLSSKPTLKEIMTSLTNLVMMEEPDESNTGSVSPSPVVPKPKPLASRSVSLNNFAYSLPTKSHDDLSGYAADVAGGSGTSATGSSLPRRPPPPTRGMSLGSAHSLNASSSTSKSHTTHVNATVAIHSGSGPISTTPTTTTNSNANHPTIDIPKSASEGSVLTPSDPVSASAIKSPSSSLLSPISPSKSGSIRQGGSVLPALAVKKFVDMLNIALSLDPDTHKPSSTVHPKDLVSIICNKNAAQLRQISDAFARRSDITLKLAVAEWSGGEKTHLGRLLEDLLLVGPKEVECKLVNRCLVKREGSSEAREVKKDEESLLELLAGKSNEFLLSFCTTYNNQFRLAIDDAVEKYFKPPVSHIFLALLSGRDEPDIARDEEQDVKALNSKDVDQLIILLCTRNMHHLHQLFSTRVSADEMVASLPEESQPFIRSLCSAVLNYYDFSAQQFYISIALIDEAMQNSSSSSGLMASRMNLSDSNNNNDNKCFDLLNRLVAEHYRDVDRFMEIAKAYESRYMTSLRDAVLHVLKPGWYREFMSVLLL